MDERWNILKITIGAVGGAVAIGVMEMASTRSAFPLFAVPFATSIVLVMGTPDAIPAQPRSLIGGHLVSTVVGLIAVQLFGSSPYVAAAAVGLAMIAMHLTRTYHPPAGIDPLIVVLNDMTWSFLLAPVGAGAVLLTAFAFVWHNLFRRGSWPAHWR
jgi:CBS-domain-containing membrane protein